MSSKKIKASEIRDIVDIDKNEYYAATRVIINGWFPWIKSPMTFMAMMREKKSRQLYRPIIRKAGSQTRYYIKGETILEVIKLSEEGDLKI